MTPKTFLTFDTETVPHPDIPRLEFDENKVTIPSNWKDPIKIQNKINEEREKFEITVDKKMSTDPDYCLVCCAVVAFFDGNNAPVVSGFSAIDSKSEFTLVTKVWEHIRAMHHDHVPIVGFNSLSFDIPVLLRRAMISDIGVSPTMVQNLMKRQEQNRHHYDLMQLLGIRSPFSGKIDDQKFSTKKQGLNYYLRLFGLGSKTDGMDGSFVYPMWQEGLHDEIREYCKTDVLKTAELFRRVSPWLVAPAKDVSDSNNGKDKTNDK
jgi:hypothetical protein